MKKIVRCVKARDHMEFIAKCDELDLKEDVEIEDYLLDEPEEPTL